MNQTVDQTQIDLTRDYFALFSLPRGYEVDQDHLQQRYHEFQQLVHPDRFASGTAQERRYSMQVTSHVNNAQKTLRDDLERAIYLLSLSGIDINAETDTRVDPGFLMEQIELREALERIPNAVDPLSAVDDFSRQ
ncbi:MAG: Fe-S protein assembly co-chaperone HscB, partial [Pseudomonadota bacterium]